MNTPIARMHAHIAIWNVIPGQTAYKNLQKKSQSIEIFPVPITLQGD